MTTTKKRQLTPAAQAAKAVRKELKGAFPKIKFSVTSENFANGDAVRISWTDGPTTEKVQEITNKYQYGSFNSMEDIYENTNYIEGMPQVKFVSTSRDMSALAKKYITELVKDQLEGLDEWSASNRIRHIFHATPILEENLKEKKRCACGTEIEDYETWCSMACCDEVY